MENNLLIEMMNANAKFKELPATKREIFYALAEDFDDNELALYLTPDELSAKLGKGNRKQWQEFLSLDVVKSYIQGQLAQAAQVASRKSLQSLSKAAASGDVQAAKQVNELSGVLNRDSNKIIILHQIARPKVAEQR